MHLGKAKKDDPKTWTLNTHVRDPDGVPGLGCSLHSYRLLGALIYFVSPFPCNYASQINNLKFFKFSFRIHAIHNGVIEPCLFKTHQKNTALYLQ